ncbi:UvrD-helicase domain-containing protein [Bacillaceae bacterium IKA-2]|nr:UvrD-helicase domain-containing protein [Bacillaceae bacterium IKA-2]
MNFNPEQETAILSEKNLVVISAGAGSGKTRVLTERYVHLCEQKLQELLGNDNFSPIGANVEEIVAITFTEKASREMKDRIRGRVEEKRATVQEHYQKDEQSLATKFWQEQLESLDTALITTFHSFCHKLLHEYAFEAKVTPSFTVLDDVQAKLIQIKIFEDMYDSPQFHKQWRPLYDFYTKNQLQEAIKAVYGQMKEIITSTDSIEEFFNSESVVQMQLASIETAQKQAITNFYLQGRYFVMELDETKKAQEKIIDHFSEVNEHVINNPINLYQILEEAMPKRVSSSWKESDPSLYELYEFLYKPLKETWKKLKGPSEEEIEEIKIIIKLFAHMLAVFHDKYDSAKNERAAMDFSDLQQKAIVLLENEAIQAACRKKYKHMMVDEFQDTNQLQMSMLKFIQPAFQFVVGDGKQSIYRFRGADVSLMNELVNFSKKDPNSDFINMSTNYRTCDSIIQFVNVTFQEIMGTEKDRDEAAYKIHYTNIDSDRKGPKERECRVEMITLPAEVEKQLDPQEVNKAVAQVVNGAEQTENDPGAQTEYEVIINRMLEMMEQKQEIVAEKMSWRAPTWRDFAILIQARTKLTKLERALKDKRIPYVVYGGIGFYDKQEVRDMLALLSWLNRPWEPLYVLALLRNPLFGLTVEAFLTIDESLGEKKSLANYIYEGLFLEDENLKLEHKAALQKLKQFYEDWVPFIPQSSMSDYLQELFQQSGLKTTLLLQRNNIQLVKNVEKLIEVLAQFQTASLDDLLSQVKQLAALSDKEGEAEIELAEGNMVHIMTVHASKGLEFPIVFLPDLAKVPKGDTGKIRFDKDVRIVVQYEKEKEEHPLKKPDQKSSPSFETIKQRSKDQAVEEAKRLFYVAATRAKDYLVLSSIDKRTNNSWYSMLQKAIEENGRLANYITEISNVKEQAEWSGTEEEYDPPTLVKRDAIPVSFSVSEIITYLNDPLKYYYKYIVKAEDEWLEDKQDSSQLFSSIASDAISGAKLGTVVHRACELLDNGYPLAEATEDALALLEDELQIEKYRKEVDKLIVNYRQLEQMNLGSTIANEWQFVVEIEGVQIIGEIDKIVEKNGLYHLIDLKTNKSQNYVELTTYYAPQLYLYKMAFEKEYKQKVSHLSLFFMRDEKEGFRTVTMPTDIEKKMREVIKKMALLKQNNASKDKY